MSDWFSDWFLMGNDTVAPADTTPGVATIPGDYSLLPPTQDPLVFTDVAPPGAAPAQASSISDVLRDLAAGNTGVAGSTAPAPATTGGGQSSWYSWIPATLNTIAGTVGSIFRSSATAPQAGTTPLSVLFGGSAPGATTTAGGTSSLTLIVLVAIAAVVLLMLPIGGRR